MYSYTDPNLKCVTVQLYPFRPVKSLFPILGIINADEADDVSSQRKLFQKVMFAEKRFCFKILTTREIPQGISYFKVGLDFLIAFVRGTSVSISGRPAVAKAQECFFCPEQILWAQ